MKYSKVFFAALTAFHLYLLLHLEFTAWPEMLFWPYLMLKGWLPYRDIGIAHSPLLVVELTAYYKLLGVGIWQQKIVSWLVPLLTDGLLVYFFGKLFGAKKALLSLAFFILFQVYYDGNGIWFDHALAVYSLTIFYILEKKNHFLVGVFWALAFLTKQTAFWFSLPVLYYLLVSKEKIKFVTDLIKGALLVLSLFFLALTIFGIQNDYFAWSIVFGIGVLPKLAAKVSSVRMMIASFAPYLVFLPLFAVKMKKKPTTILLWSIAGMMGAIPRFELFHFQPALPFLALGSALLLIYFLEAKRTFFSFVSLSILLLVFTITGRGVARRFLKEDRFYTADDKKIASVISGLTTPNQAIFVTNYWDNLYALTETFPSTRPFIPQLTQYMSQPGFEAKNVSDLISNPPKIVIRGRFIGPDDPFRFEKINDFIDNNYQMVDSVGAVDILKAIQK